VRPRVEWSMSASGEVEEGAIGGEDKTRDGAIMDHKSPPETLKVEQA
jgi:hypothetical protein